MYVNAFPNQHDYANIKLNLDGFKDIEDIASIFYPELFYQVKSSTKKEVLQGLCDRATNILRSKIFIRKYSREKRLEVLTSVNRSQYHIQCMQSLRIHLYRYVFQSSRSYGMKRIIR